MRSIAISLFALLAALAPAAAQTITGHVTDALTGAGVARATVTAQGPSSRRTFSGDDGRFSIPLDRAGRYRVLVTREGYRDARSRTVSVNPDGTVVVDVQMSPSAVALRPLTATARKRPLEVVGRFQQRLPPDTTTGGPLRAEGRRHYITVKGGFITPSVCYKLAGVADRTGQVVTLIVNARAGDYECPGASGIFTYSVALRWLPPGTYTLHVFHTFVDRPRSAQMALDTTITVQ